jgi:hypothetical protein
MALLILNTVLSQNNKDKFSKLSHENQIYKSKRKKTIDTCIKTSYIHHETVGN